MRHRVVTYLQFHNHICFYAMNDYIGCSTLCYSVSGYETYWNLKQITIEESLCVGKTRCIARFPCDITAFLSDNLMGIHDGTLYHLKAALKLTKVSLPTAMNAVEHSVLRTVCSGRYHLQRSLKVTRDHVVRQKTYEVLRAVSRTVAPFPMY